MGGELALVKLDTVGFGLGKGLINKGKLLKLSTVILKKLIYNLNELDRKP